MKIVNLPEEFIDVYKIISRRFENIDVKVEFVFSEEMETGYDGVTGYIKCNSKARLARLISIFAMLYKKGEPFVKPEKAEFDTVSYMMDLSFGAPLSLASIKEMCEYIAMMGFNQILLCMEDNYEIPGLPYFGYLRGRYTQAELKEIDDYAFSLGIELVPCIQTLGHLGRYLCWPENSRLQENPAVLLPDHEPTYEFIEKMLASATAPFRSKRVHIGCDETHGLGKGNYLKNHPLTKPIYILVEHVNRVSEICKRLGIKPMMWGDMFIAFSSDSYYNYDENAVITDEIKALVNPDVEIVFWHYGQRPNCEDKIIDKYSELCGMPIFAGGIRIWQAPLPDNIFTARHIESSLAWCKKKGVREVCLTVWAYCKTIYQTALLELCRWGELSYNDSSEGLCERFEFITGASYEAFVKMSYFNAVYSTEEQRSRASYDGSLFGNRFLESDILLNTMEIDLISNPLSAYYDGVAEYFRSIIGENPSWDYLYRYALAVFDVARTKCLISEKLTCAYKDGDKKTLGEICNILLPKYIEYLEEMNEWHYYHKDKYLRPFGTEISDKWYGYKKQRAKTAIRSIKSYLDGRTSRIAELDDLKLPYRGGPIEVNNNG